MAIWNLAFRSRSPNFAIWLHHLVVECGDCVTNVLWNVLALGLQYDCGPIREGKWCVILWCLQFGEIAGRCLHVDAS